MIQSLRHGLVAGLLLPLLMYAPFYVGPVASEWAAVSDVAGIALGVACLSVTWIAMRMQRQREGGLRFGDGLRLGIGVTVVAALVAAVVAAALHALDDTVALAVAEAFRMQAGAIGPGIAATDPVTAPLFDPAMQAVAMVLLVMTVGLTESLIGAWVLRTRAPDVR